MYLHGLFTMQPFSCY